jgi:hypothetical protein
MLRLSCDIILFSRGKQNATFARGETSATPVQEYREATGMPSHTYSGGLEKSRSIAGRYAYQPELGSQYM